MKENYSIEEILNAMDDIQKIEKNKNLRENLVKKTNNLIKNDIPTNTLKLIEEAENSIKLK